MCDKELLIGYVYGDLSASDKEAFERHAASCAECRAEVDGFRSTRAYLTSWAPPEPDLGFQIVRSARPIAVAPARRWWPSPAWGLAAAALLVLAVSAAIAHVEVRSGSDGIVVRTGWNRDAQTAQTAQSASGAAMSAEMVQKLDARIKELESQLAASQKSTTVASASADSSRMSDADMTKRVRQMIDESEQRQQGILARQILQVNREGEAARRIDFDRMLIALRQVQETTAGTSQRQQALEHLMRTGFQR
jgi:hypothetical protein